MENLDLYFRIIKKHGIAEKPNGYYERHHITPKAFGGLDTADNLVYVTARVHFLLHWLLYKGTNDPLMARAFYGMCDRNRRPERERMSSRAYQSAKEAFSKHNHMRLPEHRERVSKNASAQWADNRAIMLKSTAFMFKDESHPMYMKGKVGDAHPRSRAVMTPLGRYGSVREAARALGIPHPKVSANCKNPNINDFNYL